MDFLVWQQQALENESNMIQQIDYDREHRDQLPHMAILWWVIRIRFSFRIYIWI